MKNIKLLIWLLVFLPVFTFAQEEVEDTTEVAATEEVVKDKLERAAYESSMIIDNNTNVTFIKNTLEVVMQHRFGSIGGGENDALGLWAPTNIRLAASYSFTDRVTLGVGTTKDGRMQDFNAKVALLRQTRSGSMPINLTYYGNMGVDARQKNKGYFRNIQDRYSYFHQLIISRRMGANLSLQVAPSVAHYNLVLPTQSNDLFAVAFGGRYKVSPQTSILFDYTQPINEFEEGTPEPGLSFGVEFATSAHAFQIYFTNYKGILNQRSQFYNQNKIDFESFESIQYMLGFTITRRYNF